MIKQKCSPAVCVWQDTDVYARRLIRILRQKHGISGEVPGGFVGLSRQQVSRYDQGRSSLSLILIARFSSAFSITLVQFINEIYSLIINDAGYSSPQTISYDSFCKNNIKKFIFLLFVVYFPFYVREREGSVICTVVMMFYLLFYIFFRRTSGYEGHADGFVSVYGGLSFFRYWLYI